MRVLPSWTLPPNLGFWKFRHGKSVVLSAKLVGGRACGLHLWWSMHPGRMHIDEMDGIRTAEFQLFLTAFNTVSTTLYILYILTLFAIMVTKNTTRMKTTIEHTKRKREEARTCTNSFHVGRLQPSNSTTSICSGFVVRLVPTVS